MYYAGIGSRDTPVDICEKMTRIAQILASRNHVLRSGGAEGADKAFETGHQHINDNMQIFIPWKKFVPEIKSYHKLVTDKAAQAEASKIAEQTHPAWDKCSQGAKKLHTRNVYQVLGEDVKTPSSFVICWTKGGEDVGGTRTAIVIARENKIPVFNLFDLSDKEPMDILTHIAKNISEKL